MKGIYRGATYETEFPAIKTTETEHTGIFLGHRFTIKQHNVSQGHSTSTPLKYRGVDYTL